MGFGIRQNNMNIFVSNSKKRHIHAYDRRVIVLNVAAMIVFVPFAVAARIIYLQYKNKKEKSEQELIDSEIMNSQHSTQLYYVLSDDFSLDLESALKSVSIKHINIKTRSHLYNSESIQVEKFDFSLASLKFMDKWLTSVWENRHNIDQKKLNESAYWAAAYVGEIIIKHSSGNYKWISWEDYMKETKNRLRDMTPFSFEYQYVLLGPKTSIAFPFSRVSKFIENGPEACVELFAITTIQNRQD